MATSEPNISTTVAPIYAADLLYEQNCKCGQTEVLTNSETWSNVTAGDNVWRIDIVDTGGADSRAVPIFTVLAASNISAADCTKLVGARYTPGQSILGDFTGVSLLTGVTNPIFVVLYKDCRQS